MVGQRPVKLLVYCACLLLVWSRGLGMQLTWCYSGASELWGVQQGGGGIPIPLAMQTLLLGDFILSCAASEH